MTVQKTISRLVWGIVVSTAIMGVLFYIFMFVNPLRIHNVNLLQWIPVFICILGFYLSGRINRDTPLRFLPILYIPLVIFDLFDFFYFPFILVLAVIATLALLAARMETGGLIHSLTLLSLLAIFVYYLLSQALILENENFGRNSRGELVNATILWDLNPQKPFSLPNLVLEDPKGNEVNLQNLDDKISFMVLHDPSCESCKLDKPQLEHLKNYYRYNSRIRFVDVFLTRDKNKWNEMLIKNKPLGMQLISKNISATRRDLHISTLPLFLVVNPDGTYIPFTSFEQARETLHQTAERVRSGNQ